VVDYGREVADCYGFSWGFGGFGGGGDCGCAECSIDCELVDVPRDVVDDVPGFYAADIIVDGGAC
jgi:hypothetical protein